MKEVIEIYTKMLIAVLGFVAPSFTILTSIFFEGLEKKRKQNKIELDTIEKIILQNLSNTNNLADQLQKGHKTINEKKKQAKRDVNLLDPKRQIVRLFLPLVLSLFLISLYHFFRTNYFESNKLWLKVLVISLSFGLFVYSIFVLWQLFNVIIETKKSNFEEKLNKVVETESTQSPNSQN